MPQSLFVDFCWFQVPAGSRKGSMEAKLAFSQDSPPISIICAAKVAGIPLTVQPSLAAGSAPTLQFGSG